MSDHERPLWEATAAPGERFPELGETIDAEIGVVGAGYTGLSTALHLREMGREVVVIEAEEPGAGASGRNGGQVIRGLKHLLADVTKDYGDTLGRRLHAFGGTTADATFDLIRRYAIDCDATQTGWIQAAETDSELDQGRRRAAGWAVQGEPARPLDRAEFKTLTGTDAYAGGWIDERSGTVQPLSYVHGLARAAAKAGARLFVRSPVLSVTAEGGGWRVATARGTVRAKRVLLATNLVRGGLAPEVARSQLGVRSFQIATAPLSPEQRVHILPGRQAVSDTRRVLRYFRVDRDWRVIVGGKGTISPPRGPASFDLQRRMLAALYPELAEAPFEFFWGGRVGVTLDRLPRLFVLGDGLFAPLQDNGKGVAWCTASGAPLAEVLAGAALEGLPLVPATPPQPIPLHALQSAYVAAGSAWLRLRDRLDAGR